MFWKWSTCCHQGTKSPISPQVSRSSDMKEKKKKKKFSHNWRDILVNWQLMLTDEVMPLLISVSCHFATPSMSYCIMHIFSFFFLRSALGDLYRQGWFDPESRLKYVYLFPKWQALWWDLFILTLSSSSGILASDEQPTRESVHWGPCTVLSAGGLL